MPYNYVVYLETRIAILYFFLTVKPWLRVQGYWMSTQIGWFEMFGTVIMYIINNFYG